MDPDDEFSFSFYTDGNRGYVDSQIVNNQRNRSNIQDSEGSLNSSLTNSLNEDEFHRDNPYRTPSDPLTTITHRMSQKWQEDSSVLKCPLCKVSFGYFTRKHHCRSCSRIFCDTDSKFRAKIPKVIKKIPTRSGKEEPIDYNTPVRLCKSCFDMYENMHNMEKLLTIFSLVNLTIVDFKNISMVCKAWQPIGLFYLSKFREIQYKLPHLPYNSWEKQALWNNRLLLKNHSAWEVHVLRSLHDNNSNSVVDAQNQSTNSAHQFAYKYKKLSEVINYYYNQSKTIITRVETNGSTFPRIDTNGSTLPRVDSRETVKDNKECWRRMCTRFCQKKMNIDDVILLLDLISDPKISSEIPQSWNVLCNEIVKVLHHLDDNILECYLSYFLFKIHNGPIQQYLFLRSNNSIRIANKIFWHFKNHDKLKLSAFFEALSPEIHTVIVKSNSLVTHCRELYLNGGVSPGIEIDDIEVVSCLNPEIGSQILYTNTARFGNSATKPMFVNLNKSKILYKRDNIEKDAIIISVIKLMEKYLQREGLDVSLTTYNVQPTSKDEGLIQLVENAHTLYEISEKMKISITNYLLRHNPNDTVGNLRQKFVKSCAVYTVIAFLLSISDRNTDNLMLTEDGKFISIDFGFILGKTPKKVIPTPCMRITESMLEVLGGARSNEYEEFKDLCVHIYEILRRHVNTFICLLSIIPKFESHSKTSPSLTEEEIYTELIKRFCPGESFEEARNQLKLKIETSTSNTTFSKHTILDYLHKVNKEGTVTNVLSSTYSGTKSMLSTMYSYLYPFK